MSSILQLRSYQESCLADISEAVHGNVKRPAVELSTGLGKTFIFAHYMKQEVSASHRGIILVHTDELADQAYEEMKGIAPHLDVGIVKAGRNDINAHVIIGSVQTLANECRRQEIGPIGVGVVDEAHHATAKSYRRIMAHWDIPWVGFTATMHRADNAPLGEVWDDIVFVRDTPWAVRKGYLINPVGYRVVVPDLQLPDTDADYSDEALAGAFASSGLAPELIIDAWEEKAKDRKTLLFAPSVAESLRFAEEFARRGHFAVHVDGGLHKDVRKAILRAHKRGDFPILTNCKVLTEGYNDPEISCIINARPTKSASLYIQMVGRGLRVDPRFPAIEQDCIVLDVSPEGHSLRSIACLSTKPVDEPKNGQSLLDLENFFDAGIGPEAEEDTYYRGPVEVSEFDLLRANSARAWQRTKDGHPFMPAGKDGWVFLTEHDGTYDVQWTAKPGHAGRYACCEFAHHCKCTRWLEVRKWATEHTSLPLDLAMAWGEDFAVDLGANPFETYTSRKASWRKQKVSPEMYALAKSLGLRGSPESRAGKVSDAIERVQASRRIDTLMQGVE